MYNTFIRRINQIDNTNRKIGFKKVAGLETFFSYVDSDELLASTELVSLPTIASIEMVILLLHYIKLVETFSFI